MTRHDFNAELLDAENTVHILTQELRWKVEANEPVPIMKMEHLLRATERFNRVLRAYDEDRIEREKEEVED